MQEKNGATPVGGDGESASGLAELAEGIRREHDAAQGAFRAAVEHAIRCGRLLIEAKARVGHGNWQPWLRENFPASIRTAQAYVQLARYPNPQALADLGIEGALKRVRRPELGVGKAHNEARGETFPIWLDRRQGPWQERVRQWKALGLKPEEGRNAEGGVFSTLSITQNPSYGMEAFADQPVSIFDPHLCKIVYQWFSARGDCILDPFAGGAVRGIVAGSIGRRYVGVDLNPAQVAANEADRETFFRDKDDPRVVLPRWATGDSRKALKGGKWPEPDLVFTCPPYGDLERYSNDPADLSTMKPAQFDAAYADILAAATALLPANRFAALVVSDYRDKKSANGKLRDLRGITIRAMEAVGLDFYNDRVIADPLGTAPIRAPRLFTRTRKIVRVHQHLLVFVKGDARAATRRVRTEEEIKGLQPQDSRSGRLQSA